MLRQHPDDAGAAPDLLALTAEIVSAHVGYSSVHGGDLPKLIAAIHAALSGLGKPAEAPPAEPERPKGAVGVRKSLADPAHIISIIDGKVYRSLTRHLAKHGYTKDSYRAAFNLPKDYPLIASAYAEKRREIARTIGLGRKKTAAAVDSVREADAPLVTKAKRGARQAAAAVTDAVAPKATRTRKTAAQALRGAREHLPG